MERINRYKRNQKFEYFAGLLERDFAEHNYLRYLQELEDCNALNYSIYNLSFMPVTGALNNFKGTNRLMNEENGQKLDRGDKFIYRINDFYENKSMEHIIFLIHMAERVKLQRQKKIRRN